jgi:hypothetical protein
VRYRWLNPPDSCLVMGTVTGSGARCRRASARPTPAERRPWAALPRQGTGTWGPDGSDPGRQKHSPQGHRAPCRGRAVAWSASPRSRPCRFAPAAVARRRHTGAACRSHRCWPKTTSLSSPPAGDRTSGTLLALFIGAGSSPGSACCRCCPRARRSADRRGVVPVPQHHQVAAELGLPQAGRLLTQPGGHPVTRTGAPGR